MAVSIALMVAVAYVALRAACLPAHAAPVLGLGALLLASRPGTMSLLLGQPTPIIVLGTYVALLSARTHPRRAALGVALATIKPQFGLPLAVLLAADGAPYVAVAGLVASGIVGALALFAVARGDPSAVLGMIAAFLQRAAYIETMALAWWSRIDVQYLVSHVLGAPLGSVGTGTLAAVVLGIGIYGLRNPPDPERAADPARVTTIACLTILTCIYHHAYDTLLLTMPVVFLVAEWRRRPAGARRAPHADARASPLPALNFLATATVIERWDLRLVVEPPHRGERTRALDGARRLRARGVAPRHFLRCGAAFGEGHRPIANTPWRWASARAPGR